MRYPALALAGVAAALAPAAVAHSGGAAKGYPTVVEGAYAGAGVFSGKVRTPSRARVNGRSVRRRCAAGRQVDSATHDGTVQVSVRTTRKGRWTFTLPEEPGRTVKVFVLAKSLPGGRFCAAAVLKIQEPQP